MPTVHKPRLAFRPDPVLGWSFRPRSQIKVQFRENVTITIDARGRRTTVGGTQDLGPKIGIYGCSFAFGAGLADAETFASVLQSQFRDTRITNNGISGQSSVQSYLRFRADLAAEAVDLALFCVISDHKYRNVPHPKRMKTLQHSDWSDLGVEHVPTAVQGLDGMLHVNYVSVYQPGLTRNDFSDFLPSEFMLNQATIFVLQQIAKLADSNSVPYRVLLLDRQDAFFNAAVLASVPNSHDISIPLDSEHTFLPQDGHPNAFGSSLYAERIRPILSKALNECGSEK